jgi:signal transduction histidine kinase
MLFDIKNIIIAVVALANLGLGILVLFKDKEPKSKTHLYFSFVTYSVVFWCIAMVGYRSAPTIELSVLWSRILYLSAVFIPLIFLYFIRLFIYGEEAVKTPKSIIILIPSLVAVVLSVFPSLLIEAVKFHAGEEKEIVFRRLPYLFYFLYIVSYFSWAFFLIIKNFLKENGIKKIQLRYIMVGSISSGILGMTTNLILPTFKNFTFNWLGQILTIIFVVSIAYAITKHHLLDIKVVTVELLVGLVALILFIELLLSKSLPVILLKTGIFVAFSYLGLLLVRSVLREIKRRQELEILALKLEKANLELKKIDKAKSEFLSMASHQLRTPLTSVKGYVSMLLEGDYGKVAEEQRKVLENVLQSNERLIKMVNELLNISRIELGRIKLEKEEIQIEKLLESCYQEMVHEAEKKGLRFVFKKPDAPLPKLFVDQLKLRQVILNLIDNAIRYTPQGEIELSVEKAGSKIIIAVKDTGEGLTKKEQKEIFSSFTRGTAGLNLFVEGSGLGLYVAKKYVDLHKGRIWAESEGKGKGSTFYVELPLNAQ